MGFSLAFGPEFINVRTVFKVVILAVKRNIVTFDMLCVGNAAALVFSGRDLFSFVFELIKCTGFI